jgi:hypothetical protein
MVGFEPRLQFLIAFCCQNVNFTIKLNVSNLFILPNTIHASIMIVHWLYIMWMFSTCIYVIDNM